MKTVLLVFGTRPEAIKMCPLVKEFQKYPNRFTTIVCVTAQHREMLDQILTLYDVVPDYDLDIMQTNQDLYDITTKVLIGMRDVLQRTKPDMVFVHGDTTTSMATSLAAFYKQIPVAHVEAGLRTNNVYNPFPEEVNRQITSRIAKLNFAPTRLCKHNLIEENVNPQSIIITGNTVIDSLYHTIERIKNDSTLLASIIAAIDKSGYDVTHIGERKIILVTGHRRENVGDGIEHICTAIRMLAERYPNMDFIYPMHPNPNIRKSIFNCLGANIYSNIFLTEPLDYFSFIYMMQHSYIILTDSGGIQEEAPSLGVPVLVLRETTERPEAVAAGTVRLVGTDVDKIVEKTSQLLDNEDQYRAMAGAINPYGDGHACERIVNTMM